MRVYMNCQECRKYCKEDGVNLPCEDGEDCLQGVLEEIEEW